LFLETCTVPPSRLTSVAPKGILPSSHALRDSLIGKMHHEFAVSENIARGILELAGDNVGLFSLNIFATSAGILVHHVATLRDQRFGRLALKRV